MTQHDLPAEIRSPTGAIFHIAFYKFVLLDDPDGVVAHLRLLTENLLGSILVAGEGINGMLSGSVVALNAFQDALIGEDYFAGKFIGIKFKRSTCTSAPFGKMKVYKKPEIVPLGIAGVDEPGPVIVSGPQNGGS